MKKQIIIASLAICLTACTTNQQGKTIPDIPRIAAITQEAATLGTSEALKAHPEWKPKFILVEQELESLAANENITVEQMLKIIGQLPVNQLKSQNAQLAISSARLLVAATGWSTVEIVRAEQLRPVINALVSGMRSGGAI